MTEPEPPISIPVRETCEWCQRNLEPVTVVLPNQTGIRICDPCEPDLANWLDASPAERRESVYFDPAAPPCPAGEEIVP